MKKLTSRANVVLKKAIGVSVAPTTANSAKNSKINIGHPRSVSLELLSKFIYFKFYTLHVLERLFYILHLKTKARASILRL